MTAVTEKPLGKITALLADLGLEVTYAYDDLVFIQHSAFLLQFTDEPNALKLFTNSECNPIEANHVVANILMKFEKNGFTAESAGLYTLTQGQDQTLDIEFA